MNILYPNFPAERGWDEGPGGGRGAGYGGGLSGAGACRENLGGGTVKRTVDKVATATVQGKLNAQGDIAGEKDLMVTGNAKCRTWEAG